MKNLNPRIERLKEMLVLEERRIALQAELDSLVQQMSGLRDQLLNDSASPATAAPKQTVASRVKGGKRQARGLMKDKVMAALEAAGSAGVKVKELAEAIGTKPVNVHSWFHSALKRKEPIKKVTGGHYRLDRKGAPAADQAPTAPLAAKAPTAPKGKARRGSKARRGQLSANILAGLKEAGSTGVTVADLSDKLGVKYKNVYIWFATTGKKNPSVKKIGTAKFMLAA